METAAKKRLRIEGVVKNHPRLSRVSDYLADTYNLDKSEMERKFIDFLVKEDFQYIDNHPVHVLCFEFNTERGEFVNRTKVGGIRNSY
jgi:hypothetical protein